MNRNFERFEVGHWYKYVGSRSGGNWNTRDGMGDVLDNKHRMCKGVDVSFPTYANFEGVAHPSKWLVWDWGEGFDDWVETDKYGRKLVKEGEATINRKKPIFTETKKHNVKLLLRKKQKFTIKTEKQKRILTRK